MAHQYDQLNRITESQAYDNVNGTLTAKEDYRTSYSYDANGNLLSLHRNATTDEGRKLMMDELEYVYETNANGYERNTNKLRQVRDAVAAGNYSDDIDSQGKNNYAYDEIGNLVEDKQEGITAIDWTVYGKVQRVNKADGSFTEFRYDAAGNRIAKRFKNQAEDRTTHYVRDASGNTMAIYEQSGSSFKLIEQPIYGSDMVGQRTLAIDLTEGATNSEVTTHSVGVKAYYLKNHLGNNLVSVSDRKDADGYAVVLSATDYYAFGKTQPGRSYSGNSQIKVGFNGKRKDDEGEFGLTAYDFGARIYSPNIGRWLAVDPLSTKYPALSPYNFVANMPIIAIDPDGEKIYIVGGRKYRREVKKLLKNLSKQSSYGRYLVQEAIRSESILVISSLPDEGIGVRGTTPIDNKGNVKERLTFNLEEAGNPLDAANGTGDGALENPSEVTLAHELQHFNDQINGVQHTRVINPDSPTYEDSDGNPQWNTISSSEVRAVEGENKVRAQIGLKLRTHYAGFNVLNKEVSSTKVERYNILRSKRIPTDFDEFGKTNKPLTGGTKCSSFINAYWNHNFREKEGPSRHYGFGNSKVNSNGQNDPGSTELEEY